MLLLMLQTQFSLQDEINSNYQLSSNTNTETVKIGNSKTKNYNIHESNYQPTQVTQVVLNVPKAKKLRKLRPPTEEEFSIKKRIIDVYQQVERDAMDAMSAPLTLLSSSSHPPDQEKQPQEARSASLEPAEAAAETAQAITAPELLQHKQPPSPSSHTENQQQQQQQLMLHLNHLGNILQALNPKYIATERVRRVAFADPSTLGEPDANSSKIHSLTQKLADEEHQHEPTSATVSLHLTASSADKSDWFTTLGTIADQLDSLNERFKQLIKWDQQFIELLANTADLQLDPTQLAYKRLLLCLAQPNAYCEHEQPHIQQQPISSHQVDIQKYEDEAVRFEEQAKQQQQQDLNDALNGDEDELFKNNNKRDQVNEYPAQVEETAEFASASQGETSSEPNEFIMLQQQQQQQHRSHRAPKAGRQEQQVGATFVKHNNNNNNNQQYQQQAADENDDEDYDEEDEDDKHHRQRHELMEGKRAVERQLVSRNQRESEFVLPPAQHQQQQHQLAPPPQSQQQNRWKQPLPHYSQQAPAYEYTRPGATSGVQAHQVQPSSQRQLDPMMTTRSLQADNLQAPVVYLQPELQQVPRQNARGPPNAMMREPNQSLFKKFIHLRPAPPNNSNLNRFADFRQRFGQSRQQQQQQQHQHQAAQRQSSTFNYPHKLQAQQQQHQQRPVYLARYNPNFEQWANPIKLNELDRQKDRLTESKNKKGKWDQEKVFQCRASIIELPNQTGFNWISYLAAFSLY